jgi:nucleoside-diphosphate-sugar epimerase
MKRTHWLILAVALAWLVATSGGCYGPDNPKIVEAPAYTPPANPSPPKIPNRKQYGASKKYQDSMDRMERRASGEPEP